MCRMALRPVLLEPVVECLRAERRRSAAADPAVLATGLAALTALMAPTALPPAGAAPAAAQFRRDLEMSSTSPHDSATSAVAVLRRELSRLAAFALVRQILEEFPLSPAVQSRAAAALDSMRAVFS